MHSWARCPTLSSRNRLIKFQKIYHKSRPKKRCIFSLRGYFDRIGKLSKWNGSKFNGLASSIFIHQRGKHRSTDHNVPVPGPAGPTTLYSRALKCCEIIGDSAPSSWSFFVSNLKTCFQNGFLSRNRFVNAKLTKHLPFLYCYHFWNR